MRAAVVDQGHFRIENLPDPVPGPTDLVLRVTGCGVCGSDLKARHAMPTGAVMGHELCGEVVAIGVAVGEPWHVGNYAAVLPVFSCGACDACRAGHVAHCIRAELIGLGGAAGGFAEYVRASAALSFPLPEHLAPDAGLLAEPFAVGLHSARAGAVGDGDRVLVVGGGSVGLTCAFWARELGAATVTVSDPIAVRRDAAATFGATSLVDPGVEELGGPYDVVIECVGAPGLLDTCVQVAAEHGRVVVAGVCIEPAPFGQLGALMKELTVSFAVYYSPAEFRTVLEVFSSGRIDPTALVSRTVGLDDIDDGFAAAESGVGELKVVVDPTLLD